MGTSLSAPHHNKTVKQHRCLHVETYTFWFHVTIIQPSHWDCVNKRARLSPQACSRSELDFSVLMYPLPLEPCYDPWVVAENSAAKWPRWSSVTFFKGFQAKNLCVVQGQTTGLSGCRLHTEYEPGSSSWHPCEWFSNETSVGVAFP